MAPSDIPSDFCSQHRSCFFLISGIQGERKVATNREGEGEGHPLACQRMAEVHALDGQGGVLST